MNDAGEAINAALEGLARAALVLAQVLLLVVLQALRAVCILAVPLVKLTCIAVACFCAILLYQSVFVAYGADFPAVVLALAFVVVLHTFLVVLQPDRTWGAFLLCGIVDWLVSVVIVRAPVIVRALLPVVCLSGCIMYFAFGEKAQQNESEVNT